MIYAYIINHKGDEKGQNIQDDPSQGLVRPILEPLVRKEWYKIISKIYIIYT